MSLFFLMPIKRSNILVFCSITHVLINISPAVNDNKAQGIRFVSLYRGISFSIHGYIFRFAKLYVIMNSTRTCIVIDWSNWITNGFVDNLNDNWQIKDAFYNSMQQWTVGGKTRYAIVQSAKCYKFNSL